MNEKDPAIDTTVPHSARVWNHWLGGKDNYPVDREAGDRFLKVFPGIAGMARSSRAFQGRAVRHLAGECGIRQFLDVGTGLPTAENTHEVAQSVAPDARIVYVDNDPLVLTHARALLTSTPEGRTWYAHEDLYEPEAILEQAGRSLDLERPVGLTLLGVLGHVREYEEAVSIVRRLLAGLPPDSHLTISEGSNVHSEENVRAQDKGPDALDFRSDRALAVACWAKPCTRRGAPRGASARPIRLFAGSRGSTSPGVCSCCPESAAGLFNRFRHHGARPAHTADGPGATGLPTIFSGKLVGVVAHRAGTPEVADSARRCVRGLNDRYGRGVFGRFEYAILGEGGEHPSLGTVPNGGRAPCRAHQRFADHGYRPDERSALR